MKEYTMCFIRKNDQVLMLNRHKRPNMGLWVGVGGKIELGETPLECALRESKEETGLSLEVMSLAGVVTWLSADPGIMYTFVASLPPGDSLIGFSLNTEEGILAWKEVNWLLDANNKGVPRHIATILPSVLSDTVPCEHRFIEGNGPTLYELHSLPTNICGNAKYYPRWMREHTLTS